MLIALGAGLWAASPQSREPSVTRAADRLTRDARMRWIFAVLVFLAAGIYLRWTAVDAGLPVESRTRGLAVLLLVGAPGYALGWLLATLQQRARLAGYANLATAALVGYGIGALLAAAFLIPRFDPEFVFLGGALVLALAGSADVRSAMPAAAARRGAMRDKIVLITGVGDRGQVGYALAEAFLAHGARVAITGPSAAVEMLAAELAPPGEVLAVRADLSQPAEVDNLVEAVRRRHGRLDALVNAVGGLSVIKSIAETSPDEWRREIERNAATVFLVCRAALPLLREARGAIINFASPAGARAAAQLGAYSAAKAAVIALTRTLALEERARGVRVNAILPGTIDTDENRRAVAEPGAIRWVTRQQVTEVALFLASDASSGISGEAIRVMGEALD